MSQDSQSKYMERKRQQSMEHMKFRVKTNKNKAESIESNYNDPWSCLEPKKVKKQTLFGRLWSFIKRARSDR